MVVPSAEHVSIVFGGEVLADTHRALRVLETSHPPVYYIPRADIRAGSLRPAEGTSLCEFKGWASYEDVVGADGRVAPAASWHYAAPAAGFEALLDHVAFYPGRMDRCLVDDELVRAQEGSFYGGWVTARIRGPFKGGPGTSGW